MEAVDEGGGVDEVAAAEGASEVGVQVFQQDLLGRHFVVGSEVLSATKWFCCSLKVWAPMV